MTHANLLAKSHPQRHRWEQRHILRLKTTSEERKVQLKQVGNSTEVIYYKLSVKVQSRTVYIELKCVCVCVCLCELIWKLCGAAYIQGVYMYFIYLVFTSICMCFYPEEKNNNQ